MYVRIEMYRAILTLICAYSTIYNARSAKTILKIAVLIKLDVIAANSDSFCKDGLYISRALESRNLSLLLLALLCNIRLKREN